MPEISVLTAVRADTPDKARWTMDLWRSLLAQEWEDWEWVVVDDASPVPPQLPAGDERLIYAQASRWRGPAACRNTAAALARGRALIVVDADDQLASPEVLAALRDVWINDESRFVYGDIQRVENGTPGRRIPFQPYDFVKTLNPIGHVPVTALMGRDCWRDAGGWKPAFEAGLEDVEFWIAAGAAGHCGVKVDGLVTLLYRQHPDRRTARMRMAGREQEMRNLIREMHADLYEGRFPVGCCGGSRNASRPVGPAQQSGQQVRFLTGDHVAGGKVWTQYNGKRGASFGVIGQVTGTRYQIPGRGAKVQVWAVDAQHLARLGRGRDFTVGVPPPEAEAERKEPEPLPERRFEAPEPELAEIVRMPTPGVVGEPVPSVTVVATTELEQAARAEPLEDLAGVARDDVLQMLEAEGWTLPRLAEAATEELTPYPGVGPATARKLVEAARDLWPTS